MSTATPTTASQVTPGGSKLETASKEDLIKLLKRQQMMMKKSGTDNEKEKSTLTSTISTLKSELETAESLVSQLRQENDDIYSSNEIITKNYKELESQSKDSQKTIGDLSTQLKRLYDEKEDFLSELDVLRDNKEQMAGLIKVLQASDSESKALVKRLEAQQEEHVVDRENERQAWKDNVQTLEDKLRESSIQLEEAQKNVELQKQLYDAKSDIASLKSEGESLKSLVREYNEQFAIETSTISQVLSSLNSHNESASNNEELEKEVEELRQSVELLEKQKQDNEETILKQQTENANLRECSTEAGENTEFQSEISDLKEKLGIVEEEKIGVKLHLDQLISENASLAEQHEAQAEIAELRCELAERDTHISELSDQIEIISSQREELKNRISEIQESEQSETESESDSLRAELETLREARDALTSSVCLLEEQNSTLTESVRTQQTHIEEAQQEVKRLSSEVEGLSSEVDELNTENDALSDEIEQLKSELLSEETRIETMLEASKESAKLVSDMELEIGKLNDELKIAIETNNRLKEDTQGSHHLMDMELADYQRAADTLQVKLNASKQEVVELELEVKKKDGTVMRLNNDIKELEKQHSSLEEMITKLKVLLMKAKKESADSKKSEEDAKKELDDARHSMEQTIQNLEEVKIEFSEVQGELLGSKEKFKRVSDEKSAVIKNLETKFSSLQSDIETERDLKGEISGEFESYKVRVHNVLKQQRTGESVIGVGEHEAIVIQLSKEVELLKCHVYEVKQSRDLVTSQKEDLEEELGVLIRNLERGERQAGDREKFYLDRVGELEETIRQKEDQIYSNLQSSAAQRSALTESYTKTLEQTNTSHMETTQMLQSRISRLESELTNATSDPHHNTPYPLTITPNTCTPATKTPGFARLGAEGMESPSPNVVSGLEDILNSSLSRSSSRISMSALEGKEDTKVSHLSTLLSESEHNAAALQEQCTVLKGEIRRLENMLGNDHRNVEYLKNVVMKYLNSEPSAREQLVPVLSTVLQLNKEEISALTNNAGIGKKEQVPWTSTWFYSSS